MMYLFKVRERDNGGAVGRTTFLANIRRRQFTAQYVPRQYPIVLLQEAGRRQGRGLGNEEGKVMGSGLLGELGSDVEYLGLILCLKGSILTELFITL